MNDRDNSTLAHRAQRTRRENRGAVLITAMLLSAIIAVGLTAYLRLTINSARMADRGFYQAAAVNLADAGIEQAMWSLNRGDKGKLTLAQAWADWDTGLGVAARRRMDHFSLGANTTTTVDVYVTEYNPLSDEPPKIVALATVGLPGGVPPVRKAVLATTKRNSVFQKGIVAQDWIRLKGVNVDSYDSRLGAYNATLPDGRKNRFGNASLATLSKASGAVTLDNSNVWGYVLLPGKNPGILQVEHGSSIAALGSPQGTVDTSRIATTFKGQFEMIAPPTAPGFWLGKITTGMTLGWKGGSTIVYEATGIELSGGEAIRVEGPIVLMVNGKILMGGSSELQILPGGSAKIYCSDRIEIGGSSDVGGGVSNGNTHPQSLQIYGTTNKSAVQLKGNGTLAAVVYSPEASVTMSGSDQFFGAFVGRTFDLSGTADFHFDEALADLSSGDRFAVSGWAELKTAEQKQPYAAVLDFE